jgi:hypothetical protein
MSYTPPSINQFSPSPVLGQVDLKRNVLTCQVDASQSGTLVPGQAVKFTTTAGPLPQVIGCSAASDACIGFIALNFKDANYAAGAQVEVAMLGTVIHLIAAAATNRGQNVTSLPSTAGNVTPVTGSSTYPIVAQALDQIGSGNLGHFILLTQTGQVDG